VAMTGDDCIILWGTGLFGAFRTPQGIFLDNVRLDDISISKTEDCTFAVARDLNGILYSWGSNTLTNLD
jgi:hypothetical protein